VSLGDPVQLAVERRIKEPEGTRKRRKRRRRRSEFQEEEKTEAEAGLKTITSGGEGEEREREQRVAKQPALLFLSLEGQGFCRRLRRLRREARNSTLSKQVLSEGRWEEGRGAKI
jgi:hypothetical protein